MNKKKILVVTLMVMIIVVLILIIGSMQYKDKGDSGNYMDCDALMPMEVTVKAFESHDWVSEMLDFQEKGKIAPGKYGLVKEFIVDEELYFTQTILASHEMKNVIYGVYEDQQLDIPVDQVKLKDNFKAKIADEKGKPFTVDDGVETLLDPGKYYLAVYTTKKNDDFELEYSSWYGKTARNSKLNADETLMYTVVEENQANKFTIKPNKTGKIVVDVNDHCSEVQLLDSSGNLIDQSYGTLVTIDGEYKDQPCIAEFDVIKGNQYILNVVSSKEPDIMADFSSWEPMAITWGHKSDL